MLLSGMADSFPPKLREEFRNTVYKLSDELKSVETTLQKIKTITKPPDREKLVVRIDDLWKEALASPNSSSRTAI